MRYADQINEIASRWAEMGFDIPDSVHVSKDVYENMSADMERWNHSYSPSGYRQIEFYSMFGSHRIVVDINLPPNTLHMNRMTLNDIIVEDILLDDPNFDFFDD